MILIFIPDSSILNSHHNIEKYGNTTHSNMFTSYFFKILKKENVSHKCTYIPSPQSLD